MSGLPRKERGEGGGKWQGEAGGGEDAAGFHGGKCGKTEKMLKG